jgi:hypothetical protein
MRRLRRERASASDRAEERVTASDRAEERATASERAGGGAGDSERVEERATVSGVWDSERVFGRARGRGPRGGSSVSDRVGRSTSGDGREGTAGRIEKRALGRSRSW